MWVTINKALWVQINIQNPQKVSDHHQSSICIDNIQSSHSVSKHPQSSIGTDNNQCSNSMSNHQQSSICIDNIQSSHSVSKHPQSFVSTNHIQSPTINKAVGADNIQSTMWVNIHKALWIQIIFRAQPSTKLWEQIIFRAQCE
jgi:hypothetical protein